MKLKPIDLIDWGCSTIAGYEIYPGEFVRLVDNRRNNGGYYVVERATADFPAYHFEQLFKSANLQECKGKLHEIAKAIAESE